MRLPLFLILSLWLVSNVHAQSELDFSCFISKASELAEYDTIIQETLKYNKLNIDAPSMDERWEELTTDSPELKTILDNPAAEDILSFIKTTSIEGEGFLIGENGGLVAATNKTTDYYQGDEAQFIKTIKLQPGEAWVKPNIHDKSAASMLVKIAVPVFDRTQKGRRPIGVLVVGLHEFVLELHSDCRDFSDEP